MAELTPHESDIVNEYKHDLDDLMQDRLEHMGVQVAITHFTGDSSFPAEYSLRYSFVHGMGPTLDMAVADFIEKLLKHVPVEHLDEADRKKLDYLAQSFEESEE